LLVCYFSSMNLYYYLVCIELTIVLNWVYWVFLKLRNCVQWWEWSFYTLLFIDFKNTPVFIGNWIENLSLKMGGCFFEQKMSGGWIINWFAILWNIFRPPMVWGSESPCSRLFFTQISLLLLGLAVIYMYNVFHDPPNLKVYFWKNIP